MPDARQDAALRHETAGSLVGSAPVRTKTKALLVFPLFNMGSFWGLVDTCKVAGVRCPAPPLGLMTLAALLPKTWDVRLVDCNATPLTDADLGWADLVMTGGMLPQSPGTVEVLRRCKAQGVPVCLGGPDASSRPEFYISQGADLLVLGEVEGVIADFVAAWERGEQTGRFEGPKFQVDVTKTPVPRFDLVDPANYLMMNVQFSRGCPFNCEFCDIIELYGRVPRSKTNAQMIAELNALYATGHYGHVDFCDDNLIGNKKALKKFLPELIAWQKERNYPFRFSTEASINLSDDEELLAMLGQANFFVVFIGIESDDTETLVSMQKKQNTRRSLAESVHRVYNAGIFVVAGFIVGFDTEKDAVTANMVRLIEETSIPIGIVGLLTALPNTQLWRRLDREGRLHKEALDRLDGRGDQMVSGLNFDTLRPRREILVDYKAVLERVYAPEAFFGRLTGVAKHLHRPSMELTINWPLVRKNLVAFGRLGREILRRPKMIRPCLRFVVECLRTNPGAFEWLLMNIAVYLHVGRYTAYVINELARQIQEIDASIAPPRQLEPVARPAAA